MDIKTPFIRISTLTTFQLLLLLPMEEDDWLVLPCCCCCCPWKLPYTFV